jgi:hypothetical protein
MFLAFMRIVALMRQTVDKKYVIMAIGGMVEFLPHYCWLKSDAWYPRHEMQPEAGVVGPLLAIAFILGTAIFRSLSERSGQVPASTLTNSVANDPTATNAVA